jgi:hypothetical protein
MSKVGQEISEQRVEAIRLVHEKSVAGVFENFQARTADALLHILTEADEGALRRHDDQCRLIDFRQRGGPVVGDEISGPNCAIDGVWRARRDSNSRPSGSKPDALSS